MRKNQEETRKAKKNQKESRRTRRIIKQARIQDFGQEETIISLVEQIFFLPPPGVFSPQLLKKIN